MPLIYGEKVPGFTLKSSGGAEISLSELNREKPVFLLFFPLAFSDPAKEMLDRVRDNMKFYKSLDTEVAAISVDSYLSLRTFKQAQSLNFILLSDFNKKVSSQFGCLYDDYHGMKRVSKRALFVIGRGGILRYRQILEEDSQLPDFKPVQKILATGV